MTRRLRDAGHNMHAKETEHQRYRNGSPVLVTRPSIPLLPLAPLLPLLLFALLLPSSFSPAAALPPPHARLHLPRTRVSSRLGAAAKTIWSLAAGALNQTVHDSMDPLTMQLHGGPLLVGPVLSVYVIYYGTEWKRSERRLVEGFIRGLDGQSRGTVKEWWRLTTEWYKDGQGRSISNTVSEARCVRRGACLVGIR